MNNTYTGAYSRRFFERIAAADTLANRNTNGINVGTSGPVNPTKRFFLMVGWNGAMGNVTGTGNYSYATGNAPANSGAATAAEGDTITLTATPDAGYHFVKWQGGPVDGNTNKTVDVTMNGNYSVVAVFAADEYDNKDQHPQTETLTQKATAFVMKWWWAILIVGYIIYNETKGGKQ